jgi:hypothetical protein
MPWCQFDDHFADAVEALTAGPEACGAHLWATCWAAAHLSDGALPSVVADRILAACDDGDAILRRLLDAGLWAPVEGGYVMPGFLDANRSRERVEADRARKQEAGRRGGLAKAAKDRAAHGRR